MTSNRGPARAAQYLRMSTERQDYSLEFQTATNVAYALEHGYEIVRTYTDAGISGLTIERRDGLKTLLSDVVDGTADYSVVLVYDVSRWGRFQNPDQSAHYEFICSEMGVRVEYCAEPFDNDGSPTSALLKHVKRAMAAEYSRDLSAKVMRSQHGLLREGYWVWGEAPYGYRREIVDKDGRLYRPSEDGVWRKKQGIHTRIVLADPEVVARVQGMFRSYLRCGNLAAVARKLNQQSVPAPRGGIWSAHVVGSILSNEIYLGRTIGGRRSGVLGGRVTEFAPRSSWTIVEGGAPAIVSEKMFAAVQRRRMVVAHRITADEALEDLRRIVREHGTLTQGLIRRRGRWAIGVYHRCLGTLDRMRELLGVDPPPNYLRHIEHIRQANLGRWYKKRIYDDDELIERLRRLLAEKGYLTRDLITNDPSLPCAWTYSQRFGGMAEAYRRVGYEPRGVQLNALRSPKKKARPGLPLAFDRDGRPRLAPPEK